MFDKRCLQYTRSLSKVFRTTRVKAYPLIDSNAHPVICPITERMDRESWTRLEKRDPRLSDEKTVEPGTATPSKESRDLTSKTKRYGSIV